MNGIGALQAWLAARLLSLATAGLRAGHPDWADAMAGEAERVPAEARLGWAAGCVRASLRISGAAQAAAYALALMGGVAGLCLYQWNADEGLGTLVVTGAVGLGLGLVSPSRFRLSGVAIGAVVAAVNAFETLSGVRPAYEVVEHSLVHDLRWLILIPPALFTAALGRAAALRLKS